MTLPNDIARCAGFGDGPEGWLEECLTCQRRTAPGGDFHMAPPQIITFFCEYCIPEVAP